MYLPKVWLQEEIVQCNHKRPNPILKVGQILLWCEADHCVSTEIEKISLGHGDSAQLEKNLSLHNAVAIEDSVVIEGSLNIWPFTRMKICRLCFVLTKQVGDKFDQLLSNPSKIAKDNSKFSRRAKLAKSGRHWHDFLQFRTKLFRSSGGAEV